MRGLLGQELSSSNIDKFNDRQLEVLERCLEERPDAGVEHLPANHGEYPFQMEAGLSARRK